MGLKNINIKLNASKRPLDIIYLIDTSGSMNGRKIETVNKAMHELENALRKEALDNPEVDVKVRIATFGDNKAQWHLEERTSPEDFRYRDIDYVYGKTPLGGVLRLVADSFKNDEISSRSLKPLIILLSDGRPSDDFENGLNELFDNVWGKNAKKIAIAIGSDCHKEILSKFTTDSSLVLSADRPSVLFNIIHWTSTLVTQTSRHLNDSDRGDTDSPLIMPDCSAQSMLTMGDENDHF